MHLNDVTHDGQTKAQTAVLARGGAVRLTESIENVRQELRLNAHAGVIDRDLDLCPSARQPPFNAPAFVREFDRVREQIPDGLLQTVRVAEDQVALILNDGVQVDSFRFGAGSDNLNGRLKDLPDIDGTGVELESACDDSRSVEDLIDQLRLRSCASFNHLQCMVQLRLRYWIVGKYACPTQDGSQRSAQLVRDRR